MGPLPSRSLVLPKTEDSSQDPGVLLRFRGHLNNKKMLKISCLKELEGPRGGMTKVPNMFC